MHPDKLISRIKAVLSGGTGHFEIQSLANEYADLVMKIRDRVDQCVALIRAGNDYAALQVAESFPPLLDTAAKLAFVESPEWLNLCRSRNVPWPAPLDQRDIDLVNNLYGRRIGESHPLYRDYRQAIRERDELRALAILSSIIRINPDDQNARHEFLRLAEKIRDTHLRHLDELLDAGENDKALELATTLENLHLPALANAPALQRAEILRERIERDAAHAEALEAASEAATLRQIGDWENAIPLLGRCRSLEKHHDLELLAETRASLEEMENWASAKNEERIRARAHADAVRAADQALRTVTAAEPSSIPAGQIEDQLRALDRALAVAAALANPVNADPDQPTADTPEPDAELLDNARQHRAALIARRRRRATTLNAAVLLFFVVVLAAGTAWFLNQRDTHQRDNAIVRMASLPSENRLLASEEFEKQLSPSWDSHPPFAAEHRKFQTWIAEKRKRTDSTFNAAAAIAALKDSELSPASLNTQTANLESWRKQALSLPEDVRTEAAQRLATADKRLNEFRARFASAALPDINARLEHLEGAYAAALALPSSAARLKSAETLLPEVTRLDNAAQPVRYLLPPEIIQRWQHIRTTVIAARSRWACDVQADTALAGARTVDEHYRVLREIADAFSTPRADSATGTSANDQPFSTLLAAEAAARAPAQSALAPAVFKLWRVAESTSASARPFLPAVTLPFEANAAAKLTQNKIFENLYKHSLRKFPETRDAKSESILSVGPAHLERLPVGDGYELRQTIDLYKPDGTTEAVTHTFQQFGRINARGSRLDYPALTPESAFLKQFSRFYDPATGRIVEPLLALHDRVRSTPSISPLLKAWLNQELWKLAAARPGEWGILFSPTAQAANAKLATLTAATPASGNLTANSWVDTARWGNRLAALHTYYSDPQPSWQEEATAWLRVFQRISRPGFVKIGHITSEKTLYLTSRQAPAGVLLGISPEGKIIRVEAAELLAPGTNNPRPLREPLPFVPHSPVLMLETTPAAAAATTRFPATAQAPAEGWNAFVFQPIPTTPEPEPAPPPPAPAPAPASDDAPTQPAPSEKPSPEPPAETSTPTPPETPQPEPAPEELAL